MRALVKTAALPGHIELRTVPSPRPGPGEVVVQVLACGLCGTDLSLYQWPEPLAKELGMRFPIVFGHEFAGRIVQTGDGVDESRIGELVVVNPHLYCRRCYYCATGRQEICDDRPIVGVHRPGGFAEYVNVRTENVYRVNDTVPPAVAALGEPLSVAFHVASRGSVQPGWTTVIIGVGPIGLLVAMTCRAAGAECVIVVGLAQDAQRLDVARRLGFEPFVADDPALTGAVLAATGGRGAEVTFEIAGSAAGLRQALALCRKDGTVVTVGIPHDDIPIDLSAFTFAEKHLVGSRGYTPENWRQAVQMINERATELGLLVTAVLPLSEFEAAFQRMIAKDGVKILLDPSAG